MKEETQHQFMNLLPKLEFQMSLAWFMRPRMEDLSRTAPSLTSTFVGTALGHPLKLERLQTAGLRRNLKGEHGPKFSKDVLLNSKMIIN